MPFIIELTLYAQQNNKPDSVKQNVIIKKKEYKKREGWEKIVSFPGKLIYLPIKLTFKGISESVKFVDEKKVIQKSYDFLTSDDGLRGVIPTYGSRKGGGVKFFQKGLISLKSKLSLSATVGLRSRQRYQLRFRRIQLGDILSVDFLGRYQFLPDEFFFGFGMDTDFETDRTNYAHEQILIETKFGLDINDRFTAKVITGYEISNILRGRNENYVSTTDVETKETLPGLETGVNLAQFQVEIRHYSKNRLKRPTSGGIALLRGGLFQQGGDDQYGFWKATIDLSRQFHLFYNRVIVFRVGGEITEPFSNREIPFYYLSELGKQETVRGLQRSRYRQKDMVLGSIEYRYPIWTILDAFLFVDAGQVALDIFKSFSLDKIIFGYGGGIQVWGNEGLISSLTLGISKDGLRFYFGLNREL